MGGSFLQGASDTTDQTTYTYSAQNLGTASSDRYILCCVEARASQAARVVNSLTIGGVTATLVDQQTVGSITSNIICQALAAVPSGTTGDVVIIFNGAMLRSAIQLYAITNLGSVTPYDDQHSTALDPTSPLNIPANGFAVGNCITQVGNTSVTWTGLTEDVDTNVEAAITVGSASQTYVPVQNQLTILADFLSGGPVDSIGIFTSWQIGSVATSSFGMFHRVNEQLVKSNDQLTRLVAL